MSLSTESNSDTSASESESARAFKRIASAGCRGPCATSPRSEYNDALACPGVQPAAFLFERITACVQTHVQTATWPRPVASLECSLVVAYQLREPTILEPLALRRQLAQDGFLYLRSFLPCELVTIARRTLALDLASNGFLDTSTCLDLTEDPLYINPESIKDKRTPELLNRTDLHRHPDVLSVLEHDSLRRLMRSLLVTPSSDTVGLATPPSTTCLPELRTHPYKWLRAVGPSLYTGLHVDRTYFPTSSFPTLLTAWIPLDNIPTELGSLVIAPDIYLPPMKVGGDGTKSGWIHEKYLEDQTIRWESADMNRGDIVIIDPARCVHMSSRNVASPPTWRISADTRWWI